MREPTPGLLPCPAFSPQAVVMLQDGFEKEKSHSVVRVALVPGLKSAQLLLRGLGGCLCSQSSLWHWGRLWWGTGQDPAGQGSGFGAGGNILQGE